MGGGREVDRGNGAVSANEMVSCRPAPCLLAHTSITRCAKDVGQEFPQLNATPGYTREVP